MKNAPPTRRHICSFCARDVSEVGLLFRSAIGGEAPTICDRCVEVHHTIVEANNTSPALAAFLIARLNAEREAG